MNKVLLFLSVLLFSLFVVNSTNFDIEYLYLYLDEDSSTNKVSYVVDVHDELRLSQFKIELNFTDVNLKSSISTLCEKTLNFDVGVISEKISCDVPKLGNGNYEFLMEISNDSDILYLIKTSEYLFDNLNSNTKFVDLEDKTQIIIDVNSQNSVVSESGDIMIMSRIPKEVIELLNDENREDLISSDLEYEILDEDPLIAWNVEKIPTSINYTINQVISDENKDKFGVEIDRTSNSFLYTKYLVIFLILLIFIFTLKPILFNKSK